MCGPSIFTVRLEIGTRNSPESHRPDNFQYTKLWDNKGFLYRVSGGLTPTLRFSLASTCMLLYAYMVPHSHAQIHTHTHTIHMNTCKRLAKVIIIKSLLYQYLCNLTLF